MADCPCPQAPGRQITDPERHAAWHRLVVEQGGPEGLVNAATLRAARGMTGGVGTSTVVDERAVKSGKRVPGYRRRAASMGTYADWLPQFLILVQSIPTGAKFTTADLHGKIPDPPHHNHWGKATARAAELNLIAPVLIQQSELPTTKSSLVRQWERVAAAVAA